MSIQAIYQTYLQHLSMQERLALIRLLVDETIAQPQNTTPLHSVMEFAGAGKQHALEEDPQIYINQLRSEWD